VESFPDDVHTTDELPPGIMLARVPFVAFYARVLSAALNGIEAFLVEVEVNCGWGDTVSVLIISIAPA